MTSARVFLVIASAIALAHSAFGADASEPAAAGIVAPQFKPAPKTAGVGSDSVKQGAASNRTHDQVRPQVKAAKEPAAAAAQSRRSAVGPPCKPQAVPGKSLSRDAPAAGSDALPAVQSKSGSRALPSVQSKPGSKALPAVQSKPASNALPAVQSKPGSQTLPEVQSKPGLNALPAVQSPAAPELREKPTAPAMPR